MNSQDFHGIQEAYLEVVENQQFDEARGDEGLTPLQKIRKRNKEYFRNFPGETQQTSTRRAEHKAVRGERKEKGAKSAFGTMRHVGGPYKEELEIYDIILSHLLDEGYAETPQAAEAIMVNMSEEWRDDIMEKEDSEYEKASDAALDSRYGYGRASGDKRSFGRAANRSSAAAALRAIRRGERSGSGTSTEAGADAVHQGWAKTAKTSSDQTPEKKARRAGLANTPYSKLPDDEKEKDRVSFNAVKAIYNNKNR
jgi:hypothetical protein